MGKITKPSGFSEMLTRRACRFVLTCSNSERVGASLRHQSTHDVADTDASVLVDSAPSRGSGFDNIIFVPVRAHDLQFSNTATAVRCDLSEDCVEMVTFDIKGFLDAVRYDLAYALNTCMHRFTLPEREFDGACPSLLSHE